MDGVEMADGLSGSVLVIGFGRFGQIASQPLLARGIDVSIIDNDTDMIRVAGRFRLQGLLRRRHAGSTCCRRPGAGTRRSGAGLRRRQGGRRPASSNWSRPSSRWPRCMARAFDRGHAIELIRAGVDYQLRETFESAMAFGGEAIRELGASDDEVAAALERVREFDAAASSCRCSTARPAGQQLLIANADEQAREQGVAQPANDEPQDNAAA